MITIDKLTELILIRNKIYECINECNHTELSYESGLNTLIKATDQLVDAENNLVTVIETFIKNNPNLYLEAN